MIIESLSIFSTYKITKENSLKKLFIAVDKKWE